MNIVLLIGNITKDVEFVDNGVTKVARFTIAVNNGKDKDGTARPADFINIVCFGHTAQFVSDYIKKGAKVAIDGRLHTYSYEAQDGSKRYKTEVIAQSIEAMTKTAENANKDEDPFNDLIPF